jgi:hypothetical protein
MPQTVRPFGKDCRFIDLFEECPEFVRGTIHFGADLGSALGAELGVELGADPCADLLGRSLRRSPRIPSAYIHHGSSQNKMETICKDPGTFYSHLPRC